jgi:hypothetical protein
MIGLTFSESLVKVDDRKRRRFSETWGRNYSDFTTSNPRRPLLSLTVLFKTVFLKIFSHGTVFLPARNPWHTAGASETGRACQMQRRMITANTISAAYYPCVSSIYFEQIPFISFVLFAVI